MPGLPRRRRAFHSTCAAWLMLLPLSPTSGQESAAPKADTEAMRGVFPHVRLDAKAGVVEVAARVSPLLHAKDEPLFFLEAVACTPDSKEHESLVVTEAKPSHVHAALLLLGLEPGKPATWREEAGRTKAEPATGPEITVEMVYRGPEGAEVVVHPGDWIVHAKTGERFPDTDQFGWVFAGSEIRTRRSAEGEVREVYRADIEGTLIGLASFGTETIALATAISPESSVEEPVWIADLKSVPANDTPVTIRLRTTKARQNENAADATEGQSVQGQR